MIVFDLRCAVAHVFEAWFGSSDDYEDQRGRGLIACPLCGNTDVDKAVMAPAVGAKGNSAAGTSIAADSRAELLAAQRKLEAASDYVGSAFAVTARALHEGDEPPRSIYGEATIAEARDLADDGIPILPLPFRPLIRSDA
jgi:hypothetical protein